MTSSAGSFTHKLTHRTAGYSGAACDACDSTAGYVIAQQPSFAYCRRPVSLLTAQPAPQPVEDAQPMLPKPPVATSAPGGLAPPDTTGADALAPAARAGGLPKVPLIAAAAVVVAVAAVAAAAMALRHRGGRERVYALPSI